MQINAYSTRADACPHGFRAIDERPRWSANGAPDAAMGAHLAEFASYVAQQSAPGAIGHALGNHVRDVQRVYSFELDPDDPAALGALAGWADEANAVLVIDGAVLDGHGRPLLPGAHGQPSGEVPVMPEATQRATMARRWLGEAKGIQVPQPLPPVRSIAELVPQDATATALRTIALVMVADFAGSVVAGHPINVADMQAAFPRAFAELTPNERRLLDSRDPGLAQQFLPRIEAAQELLWALGRTTLDWPARRTNPDQIKALVLPRGEQAFCADAGLIQLSGLVDEYEGLYSVGWAVDAAQRQGGAVPGTDGLVVGQRLAALSWVLNRGLAWDDADARDRHPADLPL